MRYSLGVKHKRQWKKFKVSDLKFNVRCFNRWVKTESEIMTKSPIFNGLPEDFDRPCKRNLSTSSDLTFSEQEPPTKRNFVVGDNSTDDESGP